MNAVEYLKAKGRMTDKCTMDCNKCLLFADNNNTSCSCGSFEGSYPEQAVEIVENWAKEHKNKTYLAVLLERLPNLQFECDGTPNFCPQQVFKIRIKPTICDDMRCIDCWNQEYEEED